MSEASADRAFRRAGLPSFLFAAARPTDDWASALERSAVRLTFSNGSGRGKSSSGKSLRWNWYAAGGWGGVRVRTASGKSAVSGLSSRDAAALSAALEDAQKSWWRQALEVHAFALSAAEARLTKTLVV